MATVAQTVTGRYTDAGNTDSVIQTPTGVDTAATGNTFVIAFTHDPGAGTVLLEDNKGNTYDTSLRQGPIRIGNFTGDTDKGHVQLYVIQNALGGTGHRWKITFPSPAYSVLFVDIVSGPVSGIDSAGVVGRDCITTQNLIVSTGTLAQADNLLCGIVGNTAGGTITTTSPTMSIDGQEGNAGLFWPGAIVSYQTPATTAIDITVTAPNQTGPFMNGQFVVLKAGSSSESFSGGSVATVNASGASGAFAGASGGAVATISALGIAAASLLMSGGALPTAAVSATAGGSTQEAFAGGSVASVTLTSSSGATATISAGQQASVTVTPAAGGQAAESASAGSSAAVSVSTVTGSPATAVGGHGEAHHLQGPVQNLLQVPVSTQPSGSTFLVFHTGLQGNADPTDNKSNALARLTPWTAQPLWTSYGVEMFGVVDGIGGADHVFTIDKTPSTRPDEEASAIAVEVIGGTQVVGPDIAYVATASPPYSTPTVTVDGPATVFALWAGEDGGGPHTVSASDGFAFVDGWLDGISGSIQFALFSKTVTAPGTYGTTFTSTPSQGGLFGICAVRGGAGPSFEAAESASVGAVAEANVIATSGAASAVSAGVAAQVNISATAAGSSGQDFAQGAIAAVSVAPGSGAAVDAIGGAIGQISVSGSASGSAAESASGGAVSLAQVSASSGALASESTSSGAVASMLVAASSGGSVLMSGGASADVHAAATAGYSAGAPAQHLTIVYPESIGTVVFAEPVRTVKFTY